MKVFQLTNPQPQNSIESEGGAMNGSEDNNLVLVDTPDSVDELNAKFYGRFPYPWRPVKFDYYSAPDLQRVMLNQSIGNWQNSIIPERPKIWVAGCGTNQAIFTALNFPKASVFGSELSSEALELCDRTRKELGISNLVLRRESINQVEYDAEFDYIICTGVIHHNADPTATLGCLATALKPTGILELMVYNRYERLPTTAFQKAIRILGRSQNGVRFDLDLANAKKVISDVGLKNFEILRQSHIDDYPESMLADVLIQPVEYSYTVESLDALAAACNLELVAPSISPFDQNLERVSWHMEFSDRELQSSYDSLIDLQRWQITNHLQFDKSPLLWFYLQRKDCGRVRKSEKQIGEEFLDSKFVKADATQRNYLRNDNGQYALSPTPVIPQPAFMDDWSKGIFDSIDGRRSLRSIFHQLRIETTFQAVNKLRLKLTTPAFPFLIAADVLETETDRRQRLVAESKLQENSRQELKNIKRKPLTGY